MLIADNKMTKEEWKNCYNELYDIYSEYSGIYAHYKNGKNKHIRNEAAERLCVIIKRAERTIRCHEELIELVDHSDEMFSLPWFFEDLQTLLVKVEEIAQ